MHNNNRFRIRRHTSIDTPCHSIYELLMLTYTFSTDVQLLTLIAFTFFSYIYFSIPFSIPFPRNTTTKSMPSKKIKEKRQKMILNIIYACVCVYVYECLLVWLTHTKDFASDITIQIRSRIPFIFELNVSTSHNIKLKGTRKHFGDVFALIF